MAVNDLDDDMLEQLKSIGNLMERTTSSNERIARALEEMLEMYRQMAQPRK
jgi:methyl-accepting chemotaxis protein